MSEPVMIGARVTITLMMSDDSDGPTFSKIVRDEVEVEDALLDLSAALRKSRLP